MAHAAGRNYEIFPVNSMDAEARRVARFFCFGRIQGPTIIAPPEANPEFPVTLDLRITRRWRRFSSGETLRQADVGNVAHIVE